MVWQWQRNRVHRGRASRSAVASPPLADPAFVAGLRPIPTGAPGVQVPWRACDVVGVTPAGRPVEFRLDELHERNELDQRVLLAFLATECDGCDEFWNALRKFDGSELSPSVSVVVVTKGPSTIAPIEVEKAARGVDRVAVVMSDDAWTDYRVSGYPFFVLVDPASRTVLGETVAFGWPDVVSMVRQHT